MMDLSQVFSRLLLLAAILTFTRNLGLAIKIDIQQTHFRKSGGNRNTVSITCSWKDDKIIQKRPVELQIAHKGPVIAVYKHSNVTLGRNFPKNSQGFGQIGLNATTSSLKLVLNSPSKEEAGSYTCIGYYLDDAHMLTKETVSGKLTLEEPNELDAKILLQKIDSLEKKTEEFALKNSRLEEKLFYMENKTHELQRLSTEKMKTTAFSAGLGHAMKVKVNQKVVYDIVHINVNGGYNSSTGIFTCPQAGIYEFQFHAISYKKTSMWLNLMHNDDYVTSIFGYLDKNFTHGGNSAIIRLSKGDDVFIVSKEPTVLYGWVKDIDTSFSGHLLSLP